MPVFNYMARSKAGERQSGTLEASDRRMALAMIEQRGLVPISVTEGSGTSATKQSPPKHRFKLVRGERMRMRDVLIFTTELSDLLASGMTLGNALNTLARRRSGTTSDGIVSSLRNEIIRGSSLSEALRQHPRVFSGLYVNMIKAGEAGGALHEVLKRLVEHYERIQDLKEKVVMALVYPLIVLVMGAATLVFSMVNVIPKFQTVFDQMDQALPVPTQILIATSAFLTQYGLFMLLALGILGVLIHRAVKTPNGQLWWHGLLLKMPLVRGVVASGVYANLARTLGVLLTNGVPVLQALGIVEQTAGNAVISREIHNARERVTDGTSISGPLAAGKILPPMLIDMLAIGEQTGDMAGALQHIARRYESELDRNVKIFTTALEPILIVFVALAVGFVAISILMAVFNLTSGMGV